MQHQQFTIALYGDEQDRSCVIKTLLSLLAQSVKDVRILMPETFHNVTSDGRVNFLKSDDRHDFYRKALSGADSEYMIFTGPALYYEPDALQHFYDAFLQTDCDFVTTSICHKEYGECLPVYWHSLFTKEPESEYVYFDMLPGNKCFRIDFLSDQDLETEGELIRCYQKGNYYIDKNEYVIVSFPVNEYIKMLDSKEAEELSEHLMSDKPAEEGNAVPLPDEDEVLLKLRPVPENSGESRLIKHYIERALTMPVADRVLFITNRRDDMLDSNLKALYDSVDEEKIICAKSGKHSVWESIHMCEAILTSKVIVTDDYCRYLRYLPLRPEQKVIQIWHACGAFKMFGQRGTPFSTKAELAYHARYDLVSVSSENIRTVYADAFDIDVRKVKAMGVPRTDMYFDEKIKQEKKEEIFQAHPEFCKRYLVIYAPTFRDTGEDRASFIPELDFDRLSANLPEDMLFLICPHPLMTTRILPKEYDNIIEVRDINTNDMMFAADLMITDYSSVIFEYSLLNKPILFYCYDYDEYDRGFYLRYPQDLPGEMIRTQEELLAYLTDRSRHQITDNYRMFQKKYMSACDGDSSAEIAGQIHAYLTEGRAK